MSLDRAPTKTIQLSRMTERHQGMECCVVVFGTVGMRDEKY